LLDIQERLPKLRYREREIDGRHLHELEYSPKSRIGMEGLEIRLYFDFDTFRHVMTEYLYNYRLYPGSTAILKERFDDFGKVDGMILPHKYTIEYSTTTPSFIGCWILNAEQWRHNSKPDPEFFRAPKTPR